jgi:hypothetical protein
LIVSRASQEVIVIEFKPYVFVVDFKQWRISLWDPIYWTRSEDGLKIGGNLHSWEDQRQYDVSFLVDGRMTSRLEDMAGVVFEEGPLSKTYQKTDLSEEDKLRMHDRLTRMADRLWMACKYSAIRSIGKGLLSEGKESTFKVEEKDLT